jgi:hypothetical protein
VRSRQLETALSTFVEEAALALQADLDAGAEVSFELSAKPSRRGGATATPLYCYRPLTNAFIRERAAMCKGLAGYAPAASLLESFDGLERYLLSQGVNVERMDRRRGRAGAGLGALLEDVFAEQTHFELSPQRLGDALARLDAATCASANKLTLIGTLHGLTIASPELQLTKGLLVAQPDALRGAPDGAVAPRGATDVADHLLVVFSTADADAHAAIAQGREVLRELLRALRLFGDGRVTLGALAWARVGAGSWGPMALGAGGRPHGMLVVSTEQEDELRAFCNLVSRRAPQDNELAWALGRFELGCERASEYEALSDYLLALRALLEPEGPFSGLLASRLGALCATPDTRAELSERVAQALALERATIAGTAVEHAGGLALVREISDHLRALLRDVVCGHLDSDLAVVADELLASADALDVEEEASAFSAALEEPGIDPRHSSHSRHGEFDEDPLEQLAQGILPL